MFIRQRTAGDITYFSPEYNSDMKDVWLDLFAAASSVRDRRCDSKFVEDILQAYIKIETKERSEKGINGRPLLPVNREKVEQWVKKTYLNRNKNASTGRTSQSSTTAVMNLQARLVNADQPICTAVAADPTSTVAADATTINDNTPTPTKKVRKRKPQRCQKCLCFIGVGEGKHPKFQCLMDAAQSPASEERLCVKAEEKAKYKRELTQRINTARYNIKHNLLPQLDSSVQRWKRMNAPGGSYCVVCGFFYDKRLNHSNPNWHFMKFRRMEYCPWADPQQRKDEIVQRQEQSRLAYNSNR